jgi:hypothetical protein
MRKSTKCPHKIIAHSLVKYMAAMAWARARPNVLHPRQYGGINLERAYWQIFIRILFTGSLKQPHINLLADYHFRGE